MLTIEELRKILPQRYPFMMIDRVDELDPGKRVVAVKNVSINEYFFEGHFPEKPVMPGVLIIEAMAQASIVLFYRNNPSQVNENKIYYLGSLKAKFLSPVFPGDRMLITVEPIKVLSNAALVKAGVKVKDKEVAEAEISFSIKEEGHA